MNMAGSNDLPTEIILEALTIALPDGFENCARERVFVLAKPFLEQHKWLSRRHIELSLLFGVCASKDILLELSLYATRLI